MRKVLLLAAASACICAPRVASAAIVEVPYDCDTHTGPYVQFTADPGEANRVTAHVEQDRLRIRDGGGPLRVGRLCKLVSTNEAVCDAPQLNATLGDRDDTLTAQGAVALGDDGNDTITTGGLLYGGAGDDVLTGGPRRDLLDGGGGADILRAGGGNDNVDDGDGPETGVGPDRIDGGAGSDRTSLGSRTTPVKVDLRNTTSGQGAQGEGDTYTGIESVSVTAPEVELIGNSRANELTGSGGRVDLDGRAGNDTLVYDGIPHRLRGGLGNDVINLDGGSLNVLGVLSCGPGYDQLNYPDSLQIVPPECESVSLFDFDPYYDLYGRMRSAHGVFAAAARGLCNAWRDTPCRVVWAARQVNGKLGVTGPYVARRVQLTRPGADGTQVDLRLTRYGRRLIKRRHTVLVRLGMVRGGRFRNSFVMRLTLAVQP